jgi:toluene monooxygenase system ferredoxin subunit
VSWHKVCDVDAIETGTMKQLPVEGGEEVLVLRGGDAFFACQRLCPHLDTPLEEGMFDGETLTCHQHLWQWDIATGDPKGLAESPLQCFRVKTENGSVYVWRDD